MVDYRLATEILSRWLHTGDGASKEEIDQIVSPGVAHRYFSIEAFSRGFAVWRETLLKTVREEAGNHLSHTELEEICEHISRGLDASLVRSSRAFDREHQRLEQQIASERKRLAHDALHDPLTGLPNRLLLDERARHALAAARRYRERVALLFIDLDRFKAVNDRLGHAAGDRVLCDAASRILDSVRPADTVSRLGGDEFVVLCERLVDPTEAVAISSRTLNALSRPYEVQGRHVEVGASVGVTFSAETTDPTQLLSEADAAMYLAKRRGGAQLAEAHELAPQAPTS
jgi:diguanylate cyclase (GGDEF)-like protein